jgi:hypothetical protein
MVISKPITKTDAIAEVIAEEADAVAGDANKAPWCETQPVSPATQLAKKTLERSRRLGDGLMRITSPYLGSPKLPR